MTHIQNDPRGSGPHGSRTVQLGGFEQTQNSGTRPTSQAAALIAEARAQSQAHLFAGLSGGGAQAEADLNLASFYSRRAEQLALFSGVLS